MAANVKLKDIGEIKCKTKYEGGEWLVLYNDPDNPNSGKGHAEFVSIWGAGRRHRNPKEALCGLAVDLRRRQYTGNLKNLTPSRVKRGGDAV